MIIIPSLLEYDTKTLEQKIDLIRTESEKFYNLTGQTELTIHLDFVLTEFAKERGVKPSLSVKTVMNIIKEKFGKRNLDISLHLMGTEKDEKEALTELKNVETCSGYSATIYVSKNNDFESMLPYGWSIGKWYDLDQWSSCKFKDGASSLLMTVKAGKSGQKMELSSQMQSLLIAKQNPEHYFLVDGGWSINSKSNINNIGIVTHSSFWRAMGK